MKTFTIAVVQFTPQFGKKKQNLARMQQLVADVTADIIVFPELCTTGYFFQTRDEAAAVAETATGAGADFFRRMAIEHQAIVVAGFAERVANNLYNSCMVIVPEITKPYVYRKTHLFYKEKICFDPGDTGFIVVKDTQRDVSVGPMICYDWRFPEAARVLMLGGADVIVCPANLVTKAWQKVMPARAIENNVYLALANRAGKEKRQNEQLTFQGKSAIYDIDGRILKAAAASGDEVLCCEIEPHRARDKSFNALNDIITDRQPQHYKALTRKHRPT
jgi:predicted amidohydrolase